MRSFKHRARMIASTLLSMTLACGLSACATPRVTIQGALGCGKLVPERLRQPVKSAPLPADSTVGEWIAFGDAQSGRLDVANEYKAAALEIVDRCEALQAEKPKRWWQVWRR